MGSQERSAAQLNSITSRGRLTIQGHHSRPFFGHRPFSSFDPRHPDTPRVHSDCDLLLMLSILRPEPHGILPISFRAREAILAEDDIEPSPCTDIGRQRPPRLDEFHPALGEVRHTPRLLVAVEGDRHRRHGYILMTAFHQHLCLADRRSHLLRCQIELPLLLPVPEHRHRCERGDRKEEKNEQQLKEKKARAM